MRGRTRPSPPHPPSERQAGKCTVTRRDLLLHPPSERQAGKCTVTRRDSLLERQDSPLHPLRADITGTSEEPAPKVEAVLP